MFSWSVLFLALTIISGVLGFSGMAAFATNIAQVSFFLFLFLFIISSISTAIKRKRLSGNQAQ